MQTSEQIDLISAAMSAFTGEVQDVSKSVQGFGYKYGAIDAYLRVARPLLAKNGLALVQAPYSSDDTVTVTTLLTHSSGQWIKSELCLLIEKKKGMSDAQCAGMVITYARRYALSSMLGMASEDDDAARDRTKIEVPSADDFMGERETIAACESVAQLADAWKLLSVQARMALNEHKNTRKKELDHAQG
jgi:hypothetical protein